MSEALRAAAERIVAKWHHGDNDDAYQVASRWLDEHPAGDEEGIDERWLDSVCTRIHTPPQNHPGLSVSSFKISKTHWLIIQRDPDDPPGEWLTRLCVRFKDEFDNRQTKYTPLRIVTTRGHVRRLLAALGTSSPPPAAAQ